MQDEQRQAPADGVSFPAPLSGVDQVSERRLGNERLLGAAVGITMTRYGMSFDKASAFLEELAARHGQRPADLARLITSSAWPATGERPAPAVGESAPSPAGRLLDLLVESPDLHDLLVAVSRLAVESIPGCGSASITVIRDGATATTVASSDERALKVDEMQYSEGFGPCLQAARTDEVVRIEGLGSQPVTGRWKAQAVEAGIGAVLALPLASGADISAALNLYALESGHWPDEAQTMAEDLAVYTGDVLTLAYRQADLRDEVDRASSSAGWRTTGETPPPPHPEL